jgi:prophage antirepressor-like protein
MEIVKAFNENGMSQSIMIKGTTSNPLFRASDIGAILEISNVRQNIKDFDNTEKDVVCITDSIGRKQEVIFLTEFGLYQLLFISRKPIAKIFKKWICDIIKEIRLNGVYDLQKQLEKQKTELQLLENNKNKEMEEKLIKQKTLEKQKLLLNQFARSGALVYIIKVKTLTNGEYIIKIGESRIGIQNRYTEHKSKYEECLLLDCFSVDKSKDFESFLHNHENIRLNRYSNLQCHEKENELFLIGKELSYQIILNIINTNINNFNYSVRELLKEIELLKAQTNTNYNNINNELVSELIKTINALSNKVDCLEKSNKEILNKINSHQVKTTTGFNEQLPTIGPRVQKINPENLQLIKVYESVTQVMNENKNVKRPSINKAIQENTVYCGFRWLLVERNLDPNIIHYIKPTKKINIQNNGYIAKLNKEKTKILNVYLDRKTAAKLNGYQSPSALDNPVKNGNITKDHYYVLYHNCENELIENFEEEYGQPLLYKEGVGKFNEQNELLQEFKCKYDCIKILKISDKTLTKALNQNILYNGFFFKKIGEKFSVI